MRAHQSAVFSRNQRPPWMRCFAGHGGAAVASIAPTGGIVLFELAMGFAAGFIAAAIVGWQPVRAPILAGVGAAAGGLAAWSADLPIDHGRQRVAIGGGDV